MTQHSLIGKELGNYLVEALIGEGGMGAVFAAQHRFLGHRVAIKVLHGSYNTNQRITERFFQEARTTSAIDHPSIIEIVDFGCTSDGGLYLVMELLTGRSLSALLAGGALPIAEAANIGAQLADGLEAAHRKSVIHRDLKPDNIFLVAGAEGHAVKILDFGIAKVLSSSTSHTATGAILGTPRYMAPEQARGSKLVGPQSDIYSLGVILFRMVTGRTPFDGDAAELLAQALFEPPPLPSRWAPSVPAELEKLILQCLEKDPAARPRAMLEVRDRLTPWLSGAAKLGLATTGPAPLRRSTLSESVGEVIAPGAGGTTPRRRSRVALLGAALAVAVLAVGGAAAARFWRAPQGVAPVASMVAPPTPEPAGVLPAPMRPPGVPVTIKTTPAGAELLVDGMVVGKSPLVLTLSLPTTIEARHMGYETSRTAVTVAGEVMLALPALPSTGVATPPPPRSPAHHRAHPTKHATKDNFYVE